MGEKTADKTLDVTNMDELKNKVSDVQVTGDPGAWICLCKASSKEQGWMKSTKVMQVHRGIVLQVTTQQGEHVAEALVFVPGMKVVVDEFGGVSLLEA